MSNDVVGRGWVGADLDGTLALYDHWRGENHIGDPVPLMLQRIKDHIANGDTIKIFTARVCNGQRQIEIIQDWCEKWGLPRLEVTNVKDFSMYFLYDDRCVQVQENTGILLGRPKG
jgi:hypothetical protein